MANINLPFDIDSLRITKQHIDSKGDIIIDVVGTCTKTTCHKCGNPAKKRYGYSAPILVQHTSILDKRVYLKIKPVRYKCETCDDHTTTTEQYDWCDRNAKVTKALEKYLMRCLINSTVEDVYKKAHVGYKTIVRVLKRRVNTEVDWSQYTDLEVIGIDEISDKKGHRDYLTIISTKPKSGNLSVLGVLDNRDKATVKKFLESIPEDLRKTVKSLCTDMHDGFVYAAIEVFGQQVVVVDRYHIAKLYRKP